MTNNSELVDVIQLLDEANIPYDLQRNGKELLTDCPTCHHHKAKLSINLRSGFYRCFVCDDTGGLNKFLKLSGSAIRVPFVKDDDDALVTLGPLPISNSSHEPNTSPDAQKQVQKASQEVHWYHPSCVEYLASRGLTGLNDDVLNNIGYDRGNIVFQLISPDNKEPSALKYKATNPKSPFPYKMIGTHPGLYIPDISSFTLAKNILLVEGEIDALSVTLMLQKEGIKDTVVAATTGISNRAGVKWLAGFKNIYIWFDNETDPKLKDTVAKARQSLTEDITKAYPHAQVYNIITPHELKDANDLLKFYIPEDKTLSNLILSADQDFGAKLSRPVSFYLQDMVVYLGDRTKALGQPTLIDGLDKMLGGGKRLGEITVLLAAGKTGKNAFWHQLMYNWIEIGIPIGYASRELSPESEVLPNLLSIHYGRNMWKEFGGKGPGTINNMDLSHLLNRWPLYFAHGYGIFDFERIEGWIEELKAKGINYFWIDHFHYCLEDSENPKEISKFARQLKSIAKSMNVHIDLIVQPKQLQEGQKLNINSLRGSAAIFQALDSLLIMERVPEAKNVSRIKLEAARHRLARPGEIHLQYEPESTRMFEVSEKIDTDSIEAEKPKKSWELPN